MMIRHGQVSAIDAKNCRVRVAFTDLDNLVSAWLPVLQQSCAGNKFFSLPSVGDSVACIFEDNAQDGTGYVLGSFYNDKNEPPATGKEEVVIKFSDGARIKYSSGTLSISGIKKIDIKCEESFKVRAPDVDVKEI